MKARCFVVALCALSLGFAGSPARAQSPESPGGMAPAAAAEALGLAMIAAAETSADCGALGTHLEAELASQKLAIQVLSAAKPTAGGSLSPEHQKRLLAMAEKVKGCAGQVRSPALDDLRAALSSFGRSAKAVALASEAWCKDNCCLRVWQVACLAIPDLLTAARNARWIDCSYK